MEFARATRHEAGVPQGDFRFPLRPTCSTSLTELWPGSLPGPHSFSRGQALPQSTATGAASSQPMHLVPCLPTWFQANRAYSAPSVPLAASTDPASEDIDDAFKAAQSNKGNHPRYPSDESNNSLTFGDSIRSRGRTASLDGRIFGGIEQALAARPCHSRETGPDTATSTQTSKPESLPEHDGPFARGLGIASPSFELTDPAYKYSAFDSHSGVPGAPGCGMSHSLRSLSYFDLHTHSSNHPRQAGASFPYHPTRQQATPHAESAAIAPQMLSKMAVADLVAFVEAPRGTIAEAHSPLPAGSMHRSALPNLATFDEIVYHHATSQPDSQSPWLSTPPVLHEIGEAQHPVVTGAQNLSMRTSLSPESTDRALPSALAVEQHMMRSETASSSSSSWNQLTPSPRLHGTGFEASRSPEVSSLSSTFASIDSEIDTPSAYGRTLSSRSPHQLGTFAPQTAISESFGRVAIYEAGEGSSDHGTHGAHDTPLYGHHEELDTCSPEDYQGGVARTRMLRTQPSHPYFQHHILQPAEGRHDAVRTPLSTIRSEAAHPSSSIHDFCAPPLVAVSVHSPDSTIRAASAHVTPHLDAQWYDGPEHAMHSAPVFEHPTASNDAHSSYLDASTIRAAPAPATYDAWHSIPRAPRPRRLTRSNLRAHVAMSADSLLRRPYDHGDHALSAGAASSYDGVSPLPSHSEVPGSAGHPYPDVGQDVCMQEGIMHASQSFPICRTHSDPFPAQAVSDIMGLALPQRKFVRPSTRKPLLQRSSNLSKPPAAKGHADSDNEADSKLTLQESTMKTPLHLMPTKRSRGRRPLATPQLELDAVGDVESTMATTEAQISFSGTTKLGKARKIFICRVPGCHKCFKRSEHLRRHMRSLHTGEKPWNCVFPDCGKSFARSDNLHQHAKNIHPGWTPPTSPEDGDGTAYNTQYTGTSSPFTTS